LKKLYYIFFAISFTVLTVGASVSRHYSGGELFSIALYGEADSCCEVPDDCCDDETDLIQFSADYVITSSSSIDHQDISINLFTDYSFIGILNVFGTDEITRIIYPSDHHPPRETDAFLAQIQSYLL
jgi:hypothetical protein